MLPKEEIMFTKVLRVGKAYGAKEMITQSSRKTLVMLLLIACSVLIQLGLLTAARSVTLFI